VSDWGVLPGPLDYETYVGMVLYGEWCRRRDVYYQGLAQSLAQGAGEVPLEVVAAACETPAAARRLAFDINADRHRAREGF
jgi:hypothetical protein